MITFAHIEDYLEVLGGYREISANGKSPGPANIFGALNSTAPISLARYDVNIVNSMSSHTMNNGALTDRQGELALKLVEKYKRQFANKGVDVAPSVQNPKFRLPLRIVDRSKTLNIVGDSIVLKFPYDKKLVPLVTGAAKESKGRFNFDREKKEWYLAITEYNLNLAVGIGEQNEFEISAEVRTLMDKILEVERTPYKIELCAINGDVTITNAAYSLYKYIDEHLGGLGVHNFVKLIDYAPVLGYTVHEDILAAIKTEYSPIVYGIMSNKESHVCRLDPNDSGEELLKSVVDYATMTNRWPVCIYEPDASNRLRNTAQTLFSPEEILDTTNKKVSTPVDLSGVKCVYFNKLKRAWPHRIPILISTNAMLYGNEKQATLQGTEKVVYYTPTTLNKEAPTIAGNISNQG